MPQFSILNLIVNALFLVIGLALGYFLPQNCGGQAGRSQRDD